MLETKPREHRAWGSATYFGVEYEVTLLVRFGERTRVVVEVDDTRISVTADITKRDSRYSLITECMEQVRDQYEVHFGEPPTRQLAMAWEKALNDTWARTQLFLL